MTKQAESFREAGRDGPVKTIEEMVFEIRSWDFDRELSETQLAERLFDIARGETAGIMASQHPNLWRQIMGKIGDFSADPH